MSSYILHDILFDGVVLSITTLVSVLTRCIISFYTFLLLAYLNKMFNQSTEIDDLEELTRQTEMLPHGDRNQLDVKSMSVRECRKNVLVLEKQVEKLQILLDSAYKDLAMLRRENDTYRLINAQANRLIEDFKQKNFQLFHVTSRESSSANERGVGSSTMASFSKVEFGGEEPMPENSTKEEMEGDFVFIEDGDECTVGVPIFTNQLATATESQLLESPKGTQTSVPTVIQNNGGSRTDVVKTVAEGIQGTEPTEEGSKTDAKTVAADVPAADHVREECQNKVIMAVATEMQGVDPVRSPPGRELTKSPSDTNIFLHGSSYKKSQTQGEEDDSGIDVSGSSSDEEEELSSSVFTSSDEESLSRRSSTSTSEESIVEKKGEPKSEDCTRKNDVDYSDTGDKVKEIPSVSEVLRKASTDQGLITGSNVFKKFIREAALAFPKKPPSDSLTKLNVFSVWNRQS